MSDGSAMNGIHDTSPVVVWFRRDLRVDDQPALTAAAATGRPVIPCFVWAPDEEAPWAPGAASRWWLHQSLEQLSRSLATLGLRLILRSGPTLTTLQQLVQETGAGAVYWNRLYEPAIVRRDKGIKATLQQAGLEVQSFPGHLLHEPWAIENQQARPYQVFTPFYRAVQELGSPSTPYSQPSGILPPSRWPVRLELGELNLLPQIDWAGGLRDTWTPGEAGAIEALETFADSPVAVYKEQRDFPGVQGTSRLSPALHFGEISARRIWHTCRRNPAAEPYLRQLVWRDFAHHLLYHFPHTSEQPLREEFNHFPWRADTRDLRDWSRGQTGYPIVDAGMRELWATGWMHNRVR
ncbi:MAG: deoxyribodipyrimidine photo-lyase, partial [Kiritimatiellae bacterium]|nr:deoxyribodipyrimidine photo-lyase [Kiritimatiellia bacterium]